MKRLWQLCLLLCTVFCLTVELGYAQVPVGTITGTVYDETGAVIPNAEVTVRNKATGAERKLVSSDDGTFTAAQLPAGEYEITAVAKGFRTLRRSAIVETGAVVTAEMRMVVGAAAEVVNVEAATAQINYEQHSIDGVITRQKIQDLPLNGRNFLQLAFLEPGVTVAPGTTSQYNSQFNVSILGGDTNKTAITVDGGNVRNSIEGNSGMNFSQEVVQEFQLSSVNFDLSTGITSVGAVNIVSRTGSNEFHGSGYFFFRDHNMAAYPALARNPLIPAGENPFFVRRNPGFWVGGPIWKNRVFFFTNYEYQNQVQAFTVQPNLPSLQPLTGVYSSPYRGHLFTTRFDIKASTNNQLFLRYSHDQNKGFGPSGGAPPPSNWLQNKNWSDQSVLGWTWTPRPTMVNDFRFNYTYWQNRNLFADQSVCADPCIGLGLPQVSFAGIAGNINVGNTSNATQGRDLRRFTFLNNFSWQKGNHRIRFGGEYEYAPGTGFWGFCDPGCLGVFSPEFILNTFGAAGTAAFFPNMPRVIRTTQDVLNLPLAGGVIGLGDPSQPPPYNVDQAKVNERIRFFAQDTWRITPRFTFNYGLAWNFESTLVNRDLTKPEILRPLIGNDLSPTDNNYRNFSPSIGFAWNVDKSNKTVIRGGFGIYYETELLWRRLQERAFIGPLGNGRVQFPYQNLTNEFPGIIDVAVTAATGRPTPVPVGATLPVNTVINLTLGQYMQMYRNQFPALSQQFGQISNDLTFRNVDRNKSAQQLYPAEYPVQRSLQFNLGVQRELRRDMVLSVDYVRRVFLNTLLGEIDYNRWNRYINGVRTPVIPACVGAQRLDLSAKCSTGTFQFWTPGGREVYNGILMKLDKRFANRYQFTVSYAFTDRYGINGIVNLDNWFQTWGPQGARHILNMSGIVDLPWGFQLGIISATASRGPFTPVVGGFDIDGDGTTVELLPGTDFSRRDRGLPKSKLPAAVAEFNRLYAGKRDVRNTLIPTITLPSNFQYNDNFNSQDVRLTKKFTFRERYTLSIFGEMFNVLNIANLSDISNNVNSPAFGIPQQRQTQVFGSGGPRALQLGGRFVF